MLPSASAEGSKSDCLPLRCFWEGGSRRWGLYLVSLHNDEEGCFITKADPRPLPRASLMLQAQEENMNQLSSQGHPSLVTLCALPSSIWLA